MHVTVFFLNAQSKFRLAEGIINHDGVMMMMSRVEDCILPKIIYGSLLYARKTLMWGGGGFNIFLM